MVASIEACDWGGGLEVAGPLVEYLRDALKGRPVIRTP
jgi:hypothetical protein